MTVHASAVGTIVVIMTVHASAVCTIACGCTTATIKFAESRRLEISLLPWRVLS